MGLWLGSPMTHLFIVILVLALIGSDEIHEVQSAETAADIKPDRTSDMLNKTPQDREMTTEVELRKTRKNQDMMGDTGSLKDYHRSKEDNKTEWPATSRPKITLKPFAFLKKLTSGLSSKVNASDNAQKESIDQPRLIKGFGFGFGFG